MPALATIAAPEMAGVLVWWAVVLAAPVAVLRRRRRRAAIARIPPTGVPRGARHSPSASS